MDPNNTSSTKPSIANPTTIIGVDIDV